jgi:leucyl-tRNA synthetase
MIMSFDSNAHYDSTALERKWQAVWHEQGVHAIPDAREGVVNTYVFVTPPFTSGDAHMGHARSYTIGDACARYRRCCGDAVLFSLGFDAFGLPSEICAIERSMTPADWVERCAARMREQFDALGLSFDWSRTFVSSEPSIYRWSQWLFLELLDAGLVYQKEGQVEWCESCQTVLANLQVEDGRCWRCETLVQLVQRKQWYFGRSVYNRENDEALDTLERWSKAAMAAQRAILGRVDGVELDAHGFDGTTLTVFTPFADSIADAACVLLSPDHPEIATWASDPQVASRLVAVRRDGLQREDRKAGQMPLLDTTRTVQVASLPNPLPVLISPTVDSRYGPTAVLGVPTADDVDRAIVEQIAKPPKMVWHTREERLKVRPAVRYRATDFAISRQRSWGAPIPIVNCERCGAVPVSRDELPVRLPEDLVFSGAENALERHPSFTSCLCPSCDGPARRETDTLDCHIDAAWSELPQAVPADEREGDLFRHPELKRWLPVAQLVSGADNGPFSLNMRIIAKFLRDQGIAPWLVSGEPFECALMHEMVQREGRKMSKHLGNVIAPHDLVAEVGADAVRFAILYAAAPSKGFSWNDHALRYARRFLETLWQFAQARFSEEEDDPGEAAEHNGDERDRARLEFWCDTGIAKITSNFDALEMHQATRNIVRLFERIKTFEGMVVTRVGALSPADREAVRDALRLLARLLSPIAPHLAEEIWERGGGAGLVCQAPWPAVRAGRPLGQMSQTT